MVDRCIKTERQTYPTGDKRALDEDRSVRGKPFARRTFHNYRQAIQELFDVNIECDGSTYEYYIEDDEQLNSGSYRNWLLNTFAVTSMISDSHKLQARIVPENIPSGQKYLSVIIDAMRDGKVLNMDYQSFWRVVPQTLEVEPYFVKVFRQRWYVIGKNSYDEKVKIYALDRICSVFISDKNFTIPEDFSPETYFQDSFGIIQGEGKTYDILLKVEAEQAKYFRVLPLHDSQIETVTGPVYSIFKYHLKITYDLKQEILSFGKTVEVLAPEELRYDISNILRQACSLYDKK